MYLSNEQILAQFLYKLNYANTLLMQQIPKSRLVAGKSNHALPDGIDQARKLLRRGKYDSALAILNTLEDVFKSKNNKNGLIEVYNTKAYILTHKGKMLEASELLDVAQQFAEKTDNRLRLANVFNVRGVHHKVEGDFILALDYFLKALEIREEEDPSQTGPILNNIGLINIQLDNYETALTYLYRALELKDPENIASVANTLNNIGMCYSALKQYGKAKENFEKTLSLKKKVGDEHGIARIRNNLGELHLLQGEASKALELFQLARETKKKLNHPAEIAQSNNYVANALFDLGRAEEAMVYMEEAFEHEGKAGLQQRYKIYHTHARICKDLGLLEKAYASLERSYQLQEQFLNLENRATLRHLEQKYMISIKEKEIAETLNRQYQLYNDELEQFRMAVSHDLREPVRNIVSLMQILQSKLEGVDDSYLQRIIDLADENGILLLKLLDDLLELTKINLSKKQKSYFDIKDVVENVKKNLNLMIVENNAQINFSQEIEKIYGERSEILLLLQNLVNNGIKFHKKDEVPIIDINVSNHDSFYHIRVKDNGMGVDPKFKDHMFKLFKKFHHENEIKGTGIGLALCKRIIDKHNGIVEVDSKLGEGTEFNIQLPVPEKQ